jgi:hypothetical protein
MEGEDQHVSKANARAKAITVHCRACHTLIRFDERPALYDIVTCPECEHKFEVVKVSPIQLDWPSDFVSEDIEF